MNLSDRVLSDDELHVLALGFNFQPKFPDFPIKELIVATEDCSRSLMENLAGSLKAGMVAVLNKLKQIKINKILRT